MGDYVFLNDDVLERFKLFWGLSWFAIVKGWHATEFGVLLLFCVYTLKWTTGRLNPRTICGAMLFCVLFAISDEWHQSYIPDRFGTVTDVLIDSLGVGVVGTILLARNRAPTGSFRPSNGGTKRDRSTGPFFI